MVARTFEAMSYFHAVHRARQMGLFGQLMPVGNHMWMIWAD